MECSRPQADEHSMRGMLVRLPLACQANFFWRYLVPRSGMKRSVAQIREEKDVYTKSIECMALQWKAYVGKARLRLNTGIYPVFG